MTTIRTIAPVLPVGDIARAVEHYARLGFAVTRHDGAEPYAFAGRDDLWLHLSGVPDHDPATNGTSLYLYVDDAAALHAEWTSEPVPGHHVAPAPTSYGLLEGAHVDLDGNLLRYGSWLPGHEPG